MDVKNRKDYVEFIQEALDSLKDDAFYNAFQNYLARGKNSLTIYRKQNQKKLDRTWIDIIEDSIISFDNIVRNPRKFIEREEEIVPIELSRSITTESVKHLAQHTNLIAEIDGDNITPNKILNINKEESFGMYENRFAYTTLLKVKEFVDKRAKLIEDSSGENNIINVNLESMFYFGEKALDFSIKLKSKSTSGDNEEENAQLVKDIARVQKIQNIINTFCNSNFAKQMSKYALVRPPITRTNVILKNPNFKKVLALWQFINTYEKLGYEIHSTESLEDISKQSHDNLSDNIFLNYLFYYNMIILNNPQEKIIRKSKYSPKFIKKFLENIVNSGDLEDVEIQNVMNLQANKQLNLSPKQEKALLNAIDKALLDDEKFLLAKQREVERKEKEKAEKDEKIRLQREKKKQLDALRKERLKQREAERKAREQEKLRAQREEEARQRFEEAKKKKLADLRIKFFMKALKIRELVELAQIKARLLQNDPNFKVEEDKDILTIEDKKVRVSLAKLIRKVLEIEKREGLKMDAKNQAKIEAKLNKAKEKEEKKEAVSNTPEQADIDNKDLASDVKLEESVQETVNDEQIQEQVEEPKQEETNELIDESNKEAEPQENNFHEENSQEDALEQKDIDDSKEESKEENSKEDVSQDELPLEEEKVEEHLNEMPQEEVKESDSIESEPIEKKQEE